MMGASTAGSGNDQETNTCGIAMSHAYTIVAVFEMTDANGVAHKCVLVRNPWGSNGYSYTWHRGDANWTAALIA